MTLRSLFIPLKKIYFDQIKAGTKVLEYRRQSPFWRKRLEGREYDQIVLTSGYPKRSDMSRRLVLPWRGFTEQSISHPEFGSDFVDVYAIRVGVN